MARRATTTLPYHGEKLPLNKFCNYADRCNCVEFAHCVMWISNVDCVKIARRNCVNKKDCQATGVNTEHCVVLFGSSAAEKILIHVFVPDANAMEFLSHTKKKCLYLWMRKNKSEEKIDLNLTAIVCDSATNIYAVHLHSRVKCDNIIFCAANSTSEGPEEGVQRDTEEGSEREAGGGRGTGEGGGRLQCAGTLRTIEIILIILPLFCHHTSIDGRTATFGGQCAISGDTAVAQIVGIGATRQSERHRANATKVNKSVWCTIRRRS